MNHVPPCFLGLLFMYGAVIYAISWLISYCNIFNRKVRSTKWPGQTKWQGGVSSDTSSMKTRRGRSPLQESMSKKHRHRANNSHSAAAAPAAPAAAEAADGAISKAQKRKLQKKRAKEAARAQHDAEAKARADQKAERKAKKKNDTCQGPCSVL